MSGTMHMNTDRPGLEERLRRLLGYLHLDPDNTLLARDCAELHCRLGEPAAAHALIAPLRERLPDDLPLRFQAATIELALDNPDAAVALLAPLPALGVDHGAVRHNLAFAQGLQGRYDAALETLEADWERVRSEVPRAGLLRARLLHHTGQVAAAIAELERLLETAPDDAEALGELALLWVDADDYDAAESAARRARAAGGECYGAEVALGMAELARGEVDSARARFLAARERREEAGRSWLGLGLCELATGNSDAAALALTTAVAELPRYRPAREALAWARIGQQNVDEAESVLREAMDMEPTVGELHALLAIVFLLRGDAESAHSSLQKAETMAVPATAATTFHVRELLRLAAGAQAGNAELLRSPMGERLRAPVLRTRPGTDQ